MNAGEKFYGVYRGTVVNNIDPCSWPHHGDRPGRRWTDTLDLGNALRSHCGKADGRLHGAANWVRRLDSV